MGWVVLDRTMGDPIPMAGGVKPDSPTELDPVKPVAMKVASRKRKGALHQLRQRHVYSNRTIQNRFKPQRGDMGV